jgi:peptidoglycan/LPS O-acetylase OafA/YrhL
MFKKDNFAETKYLTGLRAYAALFVFFIHSGGFGLREFSVYTNRIVDFGKYGVIIFFVLSAYTICMSIDKQENFNYKNYIVKRFFRIAPLYYFILILAFFLGGSDYYLNLFKVENNFYNLFLHFSFLNVFNFKYQNNIIGVEWSVPIEFFYYFFIPLVYFYYKKNNKKVIIGSLIASVISIFGFILYSYFFSIDLFNWSLAKYAFSFNFGIVLYILLKGKILISKNETDLSLVLLFVLLAVFILFDFNYKDLFVTIFTGFLLLLFQNASRIKEILFENKVIMFLGTISYSIYLIHVLFFNQLKEIINTSNPFIIFGLVILLSSISYYFIEKPFIKFGAKLNYKKTLGN